MCEGTTFIYKAVQSMILFGNNRNRAIFVHFSELVYLDEGRKQQQYWNFFQVYSETNSCFCRSAL